MPGIDSSNISKIIRNVKSVTELCRMSEEDLKKLLGPKNGKELKAFLEKKVEVIKQNTQQ